MVWKCPPLHLPNWNNLWKWKTEMNTCDKCKYYTPPSDDEPKGYEYDGSCALMKYEAPILIDSAIPWDYEGYKAGVHVGPKFGCIHWEKRNET